MKIGRFEILSEIAQSEQGAVYKASDTSNGETVALKTLRLDLAAQEGQRLVERVLQEAESSKALNSQNIAALLGADEVDGQLCAAVEYVEGNSVATMLARQEGFSIWDLLDISRQVCQGLDHAHSRGVLHYSLEPAKVMVQWDGTVKILGFGISGMGSGAVAARGKAPAILHYMSPEQLRGEAMDARSNLFSWGAVLYEMATEQKAFEGEDAEVVRRAILETTPQPPEAINRKIQPALGQVILKALAKTPGERYQSGQELVEALERCKEAAQGGAAKKSSPPAPAASVPKKEPVKAATVLNAAGEEVAPSPPKKAAAAAGFGDAAAKTPKMEAGTQVRAVSARASVEVLTAGDEKMSVAPAVGPEVEPPKFRVDPMMAEGAGASNGQAVSFSELEELPPLKEVYVAPAEPPVAAEAEAAPAPLVRARTVPEKPRIAPRQVAKQAVKEIQGVPPRLMMYALSAAVVIILIVVIGIGLRIHWQNVEEERVAVPAAEEVAPAATGAKPAAAPAPSATGEPVMSETTAVTVKPRYKRKVVVPPPAPVIVPGQLAINSTPEGAQIQIDGRSDPSWVTPYTVVGVSPGQHTVSMSKAGYSPETRSIDVTAGSKALLVVHLAQLGATAVLSSEPGGASVFVDGKDTGRTTPAQMVVEKGTHTFLVRKPGYLDETTTTDLQAGQSFHFAPALRALGNADEIKTVGKFKKLFGGGDAQAGMGKVSVRTQPKGAQIAVNRRMLDKTSPVEFMLSPGHYIVDITLSGYKPIQKIITVEKGGKIALEESMVRE